MKVVMKKKEEVKEEKIQNTEYFLSYSSHSIVILTLDLSSFHSFSFIPSFHYSLY